MPTEHDIRARLNDIDDPCSLAAGARAGIEEMGLVRSVTVDGTAVQVRLAVTDPGCVMGPAFVNSARHALAEIDGVERVEVILDDWAGWSEDELAPAYRERLERVRRRRRAEGTRR